MDSNAIDQYIEGFPVETKILLRKIRKCISDAAPSAEECINYGIPTFKFHGKLVHFAGYKRHIGFYPGPSGIEAFHEELSVFKMAKGSVQFPLDKPIPYELITEIVKFRMTENLEKKDSKKR